MPPPHLDESGKMYLTTSSTLGQCLYALVSLSSHYNKSWPQRNRQQQRWLWMVLPSGQHISAVTCPALEICTVRGDALTYHYMAFSLHILLCMPTRERHIHKISYLSSLRFTKLIASDHKSFFALKTTRSNLLPRAMTCGRELYSTLPPKPPPFFTMPFCTENPPMHSEEHQRLHMLL